MIPTTGDRRRSASPAASLRCTTATAPSTAIATEAFSPSAQYYRGRHNVSLGGDFRREEFNYLSQQNPRGSFSFTGAASGVSDFQDLVQGTPDTSSIAYGNADKYLRQSVYDLYVTDDWRLKPELTVQRRRALGVRRAHDGVEEPARQSRCRARFHRRGSCAGERPHRPRSLGSTIQRRYCVRTVAPWSRALASHGGQSPAHR